MAKNTKTTGMNSASGKSEMKTVARVAGGPVDSGSKKK